jgi:hypothetical protein
MDRIGQVSMHFQDQECSKAIVIADGRIHSLHRGGFLRSRLVARLAGDRDDHALLLLDPMGDGLLRFRDGPEFMMRCVGAFGMERALYRHDGTEVLRVRFDIRQRHSGTLLLKGARLGEESQLMEAMLVYALLISQESNEHAFPTPVGS